MADDPKQPPPLREVMDDAADRLSRLSWHQGSAIVENTIRYVVGRLLEALARPEPEPVPVAASWRYYTLIDPEGRPLWRGSPPGAWPAEGLREARLWSTIDAWFDWIKDQHESTQLLLHRDGWRLAEIHATARLIGPPIESPAGAGKEAP